MTEPVPALVRDVEISAGIDPAPERDASGRRYERAFLLVRVFGEPLGVVWLPMPAGGLGATVIARAIADRHGDAIRDRLDGVVAGTMDGLPIDGLTIAGTPAAVARRDRALATGPEFTVVVCTRDRPAGLARTLKSLRRLEYRRHRVLVVDNAPGGDTAEVVGAAARDAGDCPIELLAASTPGLSHARNVAVAACPGETLAWIDDDAVADVHWLTEMAAALADWPDASAVCGAVLPAELDTRAQLLFEEFGGLVKSRGFASAVFRAGGGQSPLYPLPPFGAGANMVTRPGVIADVGGFDPALGAGSPALSAEDTLAFTEMLLRGGAIGYAPGALVRHYHRREVAELRAQLRGYGLGVTAFYTALLVRRPSTALGLPRLAPMALRDLFGANGRRQGGVGPEFPRELLGVGRRGMVGGPAAYLRGRRALGRATRAEVQRARPEAVGV